MHDLMIERRKKNYFKQVEEVFMIKGLQKDQSSEQSETELHLLRSILDQSACMVLITNSKGLIEYVNSKFT